MPKESKPSNLIQIEFKLAALHWIDPVDLREGGKTTTAGPFYREQAMKKLIRLRRAGMALRL